MQLNSVIFPAPECSYNIRDFPGELIYIPRFRTTNQPNKIANSRQRQKYYSVERQIMPKYSSQMQKDNLKHEIDMCQFIPCLWMPTLSSEGQLQNQTKNETDFGAVNHKELISEDNVERNLTNMNFNHSEILKTIDSRKNSKIMLFFHGNAEDMGSVHKILSIIKTQLKITILAVEYSGYGLFQGEKSADKVLTDCLSVYDYLTQELGVAHQDVILFGRSIGSSPSCYIAKERQQVGCMILMSPYKSLRDVARDRVGKLLSLLLADRYRNIDLIEQVKCPVLIIHGNSDELIDVSHSYSLKAHCGSKVCKLITPNTMNHNNFKLQEELIGPFKVFFKENGVKLNHTRSSTKQFKLPIQLFDIPKQIMLFDFKICKLKSKLEQTFKRKNEKTITFSRDQIKFISSRDNRFNTNDEAKTEAFPTQNSYLSKIKRGLQTGSRAVNNKSSLIEVIDKQKQGCKHMRRFTTFIHPRRSLISLKKDESINQFQTYWNQHNIAGHDLQIQTRKRNNTHRATTSNEFYQIESAMDLKEQTETLGTLIQYNTNFIPDIKSHFLLSEANENTIQKQILNQNTPSKLLHIQNTLRSFNLSPQSVKQSLPPGESVEGGTNTLNSVQSKLSATQLKAKQIAHQKKKSILEEYNQYATNRPSKNSSELNHTQSLSYIDLLNEKDLEPGQQRGKQREEGFLLMSEEECIDLEMIELTDETEMEPKQLVSQLQTLKVDEQENEFQNENKDESVCSMDMKKKFEQLDLHINTHQSRVISTKTLITSNSKSHTEYDEIQKIVPSFSVNLFKNPVFNYRTHKNTQKNSRDFGGNVNTHRGVIQNNLIKQIREYKAARSNSHSNFASNRFLSNFSAQAMGQCTLQAGMQMIKDKKLASPIKCINFIGDKDIPAQMTEERIYTQTCPGGQNNTQVTEYWIGSGPSFKPVNCENKTQKQIKSIQKNKNNFKKLQSNLQRKQHKLVTEIISELEFEDKENQNTKNMVDSIISSNEMMDNSMTINLNQRNETSFLMQKQMKRPPLLQTTDARNTTTMNTQPQTYNTTKLNGQTNGNAMDFTEEPQEALLGFVSYQQQKEAMQENRVRRKNARRLKKQSMQDTKSKELLATFDGIAEKSHFRANTMMDTQKPSVRKTKQNSQSVGCCGTRSRAGTNYQRSIDSGATKSQRCDQDRKKSWFACFRPT